MPEDRRAFGVKTQINKPVCNQCTSIGVCVGINLIRRCTRLFSLSPGSEPRCAHALYVDLPEGGTYNPHTDSGGKYPAVQLRKFKALKHIGGWSAVYCRGHNDPVRFFAVSDIGVPGGRIFGFYLVQTLGNPVLAQKMLYRKYDGAFPQTAFLCGSEKYMARSCCQK